MELYFRYHPPQGSARHPALLKAGPHGATLPRASLAARPSSWLEAPPWSVLALASSSHARSCRLRLSAASWTPRHAAPR
eukprot:9504156-Pyramimonas_sp.AAC.1